ncbi:MAG: hypothetical protein HUU54_05055 [Ignavibacteriaceae bacterium]|nr:hypothetical protein [Ignavibacteriaceae bacterium]
MRLTILSISFYFVLLFTLNLYGESSNINPGDEIEQDTSLYVPTKSPWGAVLRSAVLPGWGQVYNESYWKVPVFLGIGGWFVYNYMWNDDRYQENRLGYIQTNNLVDKSQRDFYRDQRDEFAIYLGLTYLAMLVDSYVDAQLYDFSVDEDDIINNRQYRLNIKIMF